MYQTPYELHPDRRRDESVARLFTMNRYWVLIPVPPSLWQFSPGGKGPVAEGRGVMRARSMGWSRLRAKHRPPTQLIILAESCRHLVLLLRGWETQPGACSKTHRAARSNPAASPGCWVLLAGSPRATACPGSGSGQGFPRQRLLFSSGDGREEPDPIRNCGFDAQLPFLKIALFTDVPNQCCQLHCGVLNQYLALQQRVCVRSFGVGNWKQRGEKSKYHVLLFCSIQFCLCFWA